jgi:flavin-dependent dehydrogenase
MKENPKSLKTKKLSIAIIGAGPAGSMAAYLLAQNGHEVSIFEKKKHTLRKICGEYLCPKGVELLQEMGLYEKLCGNFNELSGMVLVSPKGTIIPTYFPQSHKKEKGVSVDRRIFDQGLLDLALEEGVLLFNGQAVLKVMEISQEKWQVHTDHEIHQFDFLIAADGRQSKVGHQLGHIKEINTERAALHCFFPRKISRGQRLGEMHILGEGNYCGLDPITDDEVNFSIVCDSKRLKSESPKDIINSSIKNSPRLFSMFDLADDNTDIRIVSCLKNKNNFVAGNNLAYVGDASGFIDPLTGEGIFNALLSSKILSDSLLTHHSLSTALKAYKRKKKKLSFQKSILNHFFQIVIRSPVLIGLIVHFLQKSQKRADHFIGIVGNIHNPIKGFIKMLRA